MSAPTTPHFRCDVRTRLYAEYNAAIQRAIEMERQYLTDLNSGLSNARRIEELESANETLKLARDAYLKHINGHGCGTGYSRDGPTYFGDRR